MDTTTNLNLPIPNENAVPPTNISAEFPRIALAFVMLDTIIHTLQGVVAGKADTDHSQAMSTITGLTEALASKMPANATFSLDDLTDVQGAADALVNYVLVKKPTGQWEPSTALAALGIHNHAISEIVGLAEELVALSTAINALNSAKADKTTMIAAGTGLTGGGNLSAGRTLAVDFADKATAEAGADENKPMNALRTRQFVVNYLNWKQLDNVDLTAITQYSLNNLIFYRHLKLFGQLRMSASGNFPLLRGSTNNGTSFLANTEHSLQFTGIVSNVAANALTAGYSGYHLSNYLLSNAYDLNFDLVFSDFNKARIGPKSLRGVTTGVNQGGSSFTGTQNALNEAVTSGQVAYNAFAILASAGSMDLRLEVHGKVG